MENNAISIPQKEDRLPELRRQISEIGSRWDISEERKENVLVSQVSGQGDWMDGGATTRMESGV